MCPVQLQTVAKMEAWRAYQGAFRDFSGRVRHLQSLTTDPHPNRAAIETALIEVEKSRVVYDACRDTLALHLMPSVRRRVPPAPNSPQAINEQVRSIAELLWETAGKPDGTAEDDWRKAEEIVKRAAAAA